MNYKPSILQAILLERILNSQNKAKCFLELYLETQQKINIRKLPRLLPWGAVEQIFTQFPGINMNDNCEQQVEKKSRKCQLFFERYYYRRKQCMKKQSKRNLNLFGVIFFGIIDILSIYFIWKLFAPYFISSETQSTNTPAQEFKQNEHQTLETVEQSVFSTYFYSIGEFALRFIGGSWLGSIIWGSTGMFVNCLGGFAHRRSQCIQLEEQIRVLIQTQEQ